MVNFNPNPEAEANAAFDVVAPGTYKMRVAEITDFQSAKGNSCLKIRLEYVDPSSLLKIDGNPANNPGNVFDNGLIYEPADKQGRLRNFVEACGESWGDISDTDVLVGKEVDVKIKLDEYQGEQSNKVARYLAPTAV